MRKRISAARAGSPEGGVFPPLLRRKKSPSGAAANGKASDRIASAVSIDYPKPFEKVKRGHYAVRVHAPAAARVQASVDGSSWKDCRSAVGFFWYDWRPAKSGVYKIGARAAGASGLWSSAQERICEVVE